MKWLSIVASVSLLIFTISAQAAASNIEGEVSDISGRPLKNTEVQVRKETAPGSDFRVRTDKNGRFSANALAPGNYTVTVFVDLDMKWIAPHVNAMSGKTVHLDLNGKQIAASSAAASGQGKRAVWVLDKTGSHLSGHWSDQPYFGPQIEGVDFLGTEEFTRFQRHLGGQH